MANTPIPPHLQQLDDVAVRAYLEELRTNAFPDSWLSVSSDSGVANPGGNEATLTLSGAAGTSTSASGTTVTISSIDWTSATDNFNTSGYAIAGNIKIDGNIMSSVDTDGNMTFVPNGTGQVDIFEPPPFEAAGININGATYNPALRINDIGTAAPAQFIIHRHSTTLPAVMLGTRSNSNTNSHSTVTAGQEVLWILSAGWTGSHYDLFGHISFGADTLGTIGSTSSPGFMKFWTTKDGANTSTLAMTIDSTQKVTIEDTLEIPNGAAPTVDAAGEIAVDTTITDYTGLIKYHDGTEELSVVGMPTGNLSTTGGDVVSYNASNNEFEMTTPTVYSTGTFTPVVEGFSTTGSGSYTNQVGRYTQIGNMMHIYVRVTYSAHTGTGTLTITGLPTAAVNVSGYSPMMSCWHSNLAGNSGYTVVASVGANTSYVLLYEVNPTSAAAGVAMDAAADLIITGFYEV